MSTDVENIKQNSNYLRGSIHEGLRDHATGALADDDTQLTKFHGIYQQDDRDQRSDRARRKLEPAYSFMIRVRVPGGELSGEQWMALSQVAREHANNTLRLTTRQAVQFHGVLKGELQATIQAIDAVLLDTIAACGDVNRNVMVTALPERSSLHQDVFKLANDVSRHLTPATGAWREIWIDGQRVTEQPESEPIYGPTYLPRKFKIAFVIPPDNDGDVFAQDLGFIAIEEDQQLVGFNVTVGGGMGMSHGMPETYPRLADVIGFCPPQQVVEVAEQVVRIQREHGNRDNRKRARLKYTIDDHGLDWFVDELQHRLDTPLQAARDYQIRRHGDPLGWVADQQGGQHFCLHIPSGRVDEQGLDALDQIAQRHRGSLRISANQNLILTQVNNANRDWIEARLRDGGLIGERGPTPLQQDALACVGLPTCPLSMAESERFLPEFTDALQPVLERHGLAKQPLVVRITGCPNGCARPYLAEIALVGKAPGRYNLHLGGDGRGQRLNQLWAGNLSVADILSALDDLLERYAEQRIDQERFGDFVWRQGIVAGHQMEGAA